MKKTAKLKNKLDLVYKVYEDNPLLVTDYYNKNQTSYFIDNRHDIIIFSIIRKIHKSIELEDETFSEKR